MIHEHRNANNNAQKRTWLNRVKLAVFVNIVAIFSLNLVGQAAEPIPVETLAKLPALSGVSISRDGDYMVGLIAPPDNPKSDRQLLAVWDPRDLSKPPLLSKPDGDVEFIAAQALKAGKILLLARTRWTGSLGGCGEGKRIGSTKTYLTKIFVTDTKFSKFSEPFNTKSRRRDMSEFEEVCSQIIGTGSLVADLPLDAENVIIQNSSGIFDRKQNFVKYNLRTGESETLFKNAGKQRISRLDQKSGEILTKSDSGYKDGRYVFETLMADANGDFKVQDKLSFNSDSRNTVNVVGNIPGTKKFYVVTDQFSDKSRIYVYDAATQSYDAAPLFKNEKFDIINIVQSGRASDFGQVLGHVYEGATRQTVWKDPDLAAASAAFKRKFAGKNISLSSWTNDRSSVIVSVDGGDMAPAYFLYKKDGSAKFLGSQRPELVKTKLSPTKLIYYTARDSKQIPGLLTMPVGWKPGDAAPPAVIHPHGGPWARDYAGWDASGWVPFMSSRGYAVLQPQYRGSQGWGRDIWLSGDAEWGQKMQDDKDDGAAWMVEKGYAAKEKIAIFGYSYGGFAAFAAAVRPNSPYACAIGGAGVSDLTKLGYNWSSNRLQRAMQGKTVKGMDPMRNTDKANIPVLVFHGDRDVRVPLFHGKDFYKKVKSKVPAKLVVIKDQPHSLPWTPKMQRESLAALEDFLAKDCFASN